MRLKFFAEEQVLFAGGRCSHDPSFTIVSQAEATHAFQNHDQLMPNFTFAMQTHLSKRGEAVAEDVTEKNLRELAFDTQKYSGAAIANLVNLAAMRVERDGRDQICYQDLTDVSHYRKSLQVQRMLA